MDAHLVDHGLGLVYEDRLALVWTQLFIPPTDLQLARIAANNAEVLRIIAILDEHAPAPQDDDDALAAAVTRLDFKLNLALELLGLVLAHHLQLPPLRAARLTPTSLTWEEPTPPPLEAWMSVEIYLSPHYPRPLTLVGKVIALPNFNEQSAITLGFEYLSESVRDRIEKIIFRHHRRTIAHARRPNS